MWVLKRVQIKLHSHDIAANNATGKQAKINTESRDSIRLNELKYIDDELSSYKESLNHTRTVPLIALADYIEEQNIEKLITQN